MRYWVISDTHFGHEAIQSYCRRPPDVDARIVRNWRQLVAPEDMVLHLGDVAFGFVKLKAWLGELPGRKILVRGNHDTHTISWYMGNGFEFACDGLELGGVYYSHRPLKEIPASCKVNIHGHCHNRVPRGYRKYPHSRLFSLEYEGYKPRILSSFVSAVEKAAPSTGDDVEWATESTKLEFGKHEGRSVRWLLKNDPSYLVWLNENVKSVFLLPSLISKATEAAKEVVAEWEKTQLAELKNYY